MKKILTILTTLAFTITIENCISNFNLSTITLQNDCFKKNNVHQSNNDFIFSDLYKNNKGEIYSITNDGIYKYTNDKNTFIKMKGINELIISLKFDAKDNIYALKTNGIYKCLVNKNEFKKIGGIYLSQADNFRIYLLFSKNNVYALTTEYNDYHNKIIYKLLANENEFTLIDYKTEINNNYNIESYRFAVDNIGNIYVLSKNWNNNTTIVYKYLFEKNSFIELNGLPTKNIINSSVDLRVDSKNNIYILNLHNKFYKCLANETQFKEILLINNNNNNIQINNIVFDSENNIYVVQTDGVYKCLSNKMKLKKMTIEDNYTPRSISIDKNNNIYLIDIDGHIYKCLANEMEFKRILGWLGMPCTLLFDKNNNTYAWFKNGIYKCLTNEMEFKQMTGLARSITNVKFDDKDNIYVLAKKNYPYKCLVNEMNFKEICNKQTFNNENQFEVTYRFAAHDWIIIKIRYDIFLNMEQIYNDENQSNFQKLFYNIIIDFTKKDETGFAGGILESDYTTAISIIIEHFEEINQFFKTLSQGQGIKIITNRIGSWDKNDNMGIFNQ